MEVAMKRPLPNKLAIDRGWMQDFGEGPLAALKICSMELCD